MLIFLILSTLALDFGTKDDMDPGIIYWPKSDWNTNPIQMTSNHAGDVSDLTFTFNPSTTLTSGVFFANFPEGFPEQSLFVSNISLEAGQDISISIPNVQLPSEKGQYGPISIMTRASETGNIIDFNKLFANIVIAEKLTKARANSLSITFESSDSALISSNQAIIFNFSLTQDLWTHDLIRLKVDSHFALSNEACYSQVSFISGYNSKNLAELECEYKESEGYLYIYGLSNDVIISEISSVGSVEVSLLIKTFLTPYAANPASDFEWEIAIFRYGTNVVVEQFTGKGPIIIYGEIIMNSWKPSNHLSSSEIVSGLTTFTDIQFTLTHKLPKEGLLTIRFSGIDIKSTVWKSDESQSTTSGNTDYLLITPYIGGTCSLLTNQISCTDFYQDISPGTLTVTILSHFTGSSASISFIVTSTVSGDLIDRFIEGYTITYAISVQQQLFSYFSTSFAEDDQGNYNAGTMTDVLMYVCIQLAESLTETDSLTLYMPINTDAVKDLNAGLVSGALKVNLLSSSTILTSGYSALTSSLIGLSDPVVSQGKITISLSGLTSDTVAGDYIYLLFSSDSGSTLPGLTLPRSASNFMTKYEAIINATVNGIVYKSAQVLTILPSSLGATASLLCTDKGVLGIPLVVDIAPVVSYSLEIGSSLIVEVVFDGNVEADLGSGIEGEYPVYSSVEKVSFSLVQDDVARLRMTGLNSVLATATYSFAFPVGVISQDLNIDVRLFFLTKIRSDIEYEVMKDSISISGTSSGTSFSDVVLDTVPENSLSASDPKITQKFSIQISPFVSSGNYNSGYLGVVLPEGFSLAEPSVFSTSDSEIQATILYSFTSSNADFKLTSVYFSLSSSISVSSLTPSITIQTIQAPEYSTVKDISIFLAPSTSSGCIAYGTASSITVVHEQMTSPTISPSKVTARGPSSLTSEIQLTAKFSFQVPGGLQITLNSNWGITDLTTFAFKGLSGDYSLTQTSNTFTITGFNTLTPSSSITLNIFNLSPPESPGTTGIFDEITTFYDDALSIIIEQWTDESQDSCTVTQAGSSQGSTISEISVFPNAAGAKYVYLYLDFSLPHNIPPTGTLYISSAVGSYSGVGDQSENCWSNVKYSKCEIYEEFLMITLAEEYQGGSDFQILLDVAFDLPETAGLTTDGFAMRSIFNGIVIDADSFIEFDNKQKLNIKEVGNGVFTMGQVPLRVDPTNEGELALYVFSFSISIQIEENDSLLFSFPYEFDHSLGSIEEKFKWGEPNTNYLNCSSNALSTVQCKVDHWNLIVTGFTKPLSPNTLIDLNVSYIRNPAYTGRIFNDIGVYLYNSTKIKAVINDYAGITISQAGSSVKLKSIILDTPKLQLTSSYIFKFFLNRITLNTGDYLIVQFPLQYKISMENDDGLKCSGSWSDQSPTSLDRDDQSWNELSETCFVNELNQIAWPIVDQKLFLQTDLVQMKIEGVKNPEWGYFRSVDQYQGDSVVFGEYDIWIQKLEIYAYSGQYKKYSARSYFFEHSGFIGFYSGGESAVVNGYSANTQDNFITLIPGSQSADIEVSISSEYLRAKRLKFQAKNHKNNEVQLEFSSYSDDFVITRSKTSFYFQVSAPVTASNSLNYIEWVLEEISLDGLVNPAYIAPVKTLVEVYNKELLSFSVGVINSVYMNQATFPIPIQTSNPPNSEIIIALGLVDSSLKGVSFEPSALLFTPNINQLYFTVYVNNDTFTGKILTPIYVSFTITGTDSGAYSAISPVSFKVDEKPLMPSTDVLIFTFAELTQTSLALRVKLDAASLVYWVLGPSDLKFPSFDELVNLTVPLESQQSPFFASQSREYLNNLDGFPKSSENWQSYQKRLYSEFLGKMWYDVTYVEAELTTDISIFDWLWAGTSLTAYIYVDNKGEYYSNSTHTESTSDQNPPLKLTISFDGSVNAVYEPVIRNALALSIGVLSDLFTDPVVEESKFAWVFNADRSSGLSPLALLSYMDDTVFKSNLQYAGITSKYSVAYKEVLQSSFTVPEWVNKPESVEIGESYIVFNVSVNDNGQVCCVADEDSDLGNSMQVYLGINKNNKKIPSVCLTVTNETVYEGKIQGLESGLEYTLGCIVCSSYPTWPTCSNDTESFDFSSPASVTIDSNTDFGSFKATGTIFLILLNF